MLLPVSAVFNEAEEEKNIQPSDWLWSPAKLLSKCFFRLWNLWIETYAIELVNSPYLYITQFFTDLFFCSLPNRKLFELITILCFKLTPYFYCYLAILLLTRISSWRQKVLRPQLLPKKRKHCNTNEMLENIAIQLEKEDGRGRIKVLPFFKDLWALDVIVQSCVVNSCCSKGDEVVCMSHKWGAAEGLSLVWVQHIKAHNT